VITREHGGRTLLITQPDHAELAAKIMKAWKRDGLERSGRRSDILLAIEQHDNGWREPDSQPILDPQTGRILDFMTAPDEVRRSVWPCAANRLAGTPYAAALVAQHAIHIYRRYRGEPEWDRFFGEMEKVREHFLEAAGIRGLDDLRRDYLFVRVADLASLTFCCGWAEPQNDDAGSGYSVRLDGETLLISPDPFEGAQVELGVPARVMPGAFFSSEADARQAYGDAPVERLTGVARG